jgi:hypothetical protein
MVICIPSGITEVEERAVRDSCEQAGAKEVRLIHEPMAAAIGIGIDVLGTNRKYRGRYRRWYQRNCSYCPWVVLFVTNRSE